MSSQVGLGLIFRLLGMELTVENIVTLVVKILG